MKTLISRLMLGAAAIGGALVTALSPTPSLAEGSCARVLTAQVVALDQPFWYNRFGAVNPGGMMYALRRDVVDAYGVSLTNGGAAMPGEVHVRDDKRPRPIVLRMGVGDCMEITFQNLLSEPRRNGPGVDNQPATRTASIHVLGMELVNNISDDGSNVGRNYSSLAAPGQYRTYTLRGEAENTYLMYSTAAMTGGEGDASALAAGLFGAVNVEPAGAEFYRSQLTRAEMDMATVSHTTDGQPILDYDAKYPTGHQYEGRPILSMLNDSNELVHSDINAIITGPGRGDFQDIYPINPVVVVQTGADTERSRQEPFREFTVIFHDEIIAVQAFPAFFDEPEFEHTLHSVRDGFAINYGTGGIGSEIIANRLGVGPAFDCAECKYEEFFLTSWALGDPAMVVDVPANATDAVGNLIPGAKANVAKYPDDPSNVHRSYIGDHVKFRNIHAGPTEHHIFHLHAHQWLFNPDSDQSAYLDSQAVGPGSGYTYDINYNGSGNRNQTVGDAIFHCHFYPHFAMGMWELWRVQDTFEAGTVLATFADFDGDGTNDLMPGDGLPAAGSRAYPDSEILAGTPIPGLVPLPQLAMAPMPGGVQIVNGQVDTGAALAAQTNPGYPFFVPGVAGHRPPAPPLDTIDDGGLPRHILTAGTATSTVTPLDFSKVVDTANGVEVLETGTPIEEIAMQFHEKRLHPSFRQDGSYAEFVANGNARQMGAPFADPCIDDSGNPAVTAMRTYKSAHVELDIVFNKLGDHFPQSRINVLWGDVADTLAGTRPPEPLFFRANTDDCIVFKHTNLIPGVYEMDDYQVRTPTDIIGQHIHLVKFDVTSSDGSTNGWNYEDGVFSPDEVLERIHAINVGLDGIAGNADDGLLRPGPDGIIGTGDDVRELLAAVPHPYFGTLGAQTKVQRWYADDVLNNDGDDRTLGTVFTHDHYGPSTHQQAGLYSSLVLEPKGSQWRDPETGTLLGSRFDGGPTSWRADILTGADGADSYREFMFQFADFQLAYQAGTGGTQGNPMPSPDGVINPPGKIEVGLPYLVAKTPVCPNGTPPPCPEAISADDIGTFTVNYRNEQVAHRVRDPNTNTQAAGLAGDLSHVYRSDVVRADPALNTPPAAWPYGGMTGQETGDPFTPMMRAYENDKIQMRVQVGATEEGHTLTVQGMNWLQEPWWSNSGNRNAQMLGISEHFELVIPAGVSAKGAKPAVDYQYKMDAASDGQWNGLWGLLRAYNAGPSGLRDDLLPLPNNMDGKAPSKKGQTIKGVCPPDIKGKDPRNKSFSVAAILARDYLPGGALVYNQREGLEDPLAVIYVEQSNLKTNKKTGLLSYIGGPVEPLILRANAGDCLNVRLINLLPASVPDQDGFNLMPMVVENFNTNQVVPSADVGIRPQLVAYDMQKDGGHNVGMNVREEVNPDGTIIPEELQTVSPCDLAAVGGNLSQCPHTKYQWYAGKLSFDATGTRIATPVEFGVANLISSDPIEHSAKGAFGALVIEPEGSTWVVDADSNASARVYDEYGNLLFREHVVIIQDDVQLRNTAGDPICPIAAGDGLGGCNGPEDAEDSANKAVNYRSEPMWARMGYAPGTPLEQTNDVDFTNALSNVQVGGVDPETPVFTAYVGEPVRMRVLQPGGHPRNKVFTVHGHNWQRAPYVNDSNEIGDNPLSQVIGAQEGVGPANHFDMVLNNGAGGAFGVPGDYLWRDQASGGLDGGIWGILRVE